MPFCLVGLVLMAAVGQEASFGQRFGRSEDLYRKAADAQTAEAATRLLEAILRDAADADEKQYAYWRLGCWRARTGDPAGARDLLEKVLREAAVDSLITFRIHYDLADFYTEAWQPEAARKHVAAAWEMAEPHWKLRFKGQEVAIGGIYRIALEIKRAEFQTYGRGDRRAAHDAFSALKQKVDAQVELSRRQLGTAPVDWLLLAARCDTNLADSERHMSDTWHAIARLQSCVSYLGPFQEHVHAVQLRFGCHISLASCYTHLTRFTEARAELARAAELIARIRNGRNIGDLANARAVTSIEEGRFLFASDPADGRILDLLAKAEKQLAAARTQYDASHKNPRAYLLMHLGLIQELRADVLEARAGARPAILAQYQEARENTAEGLALLRKALPADDDIVLQVRRRLADLYRKLGQAAAAKSEAAEALARYRQRHQQEDEDILGRGLLLQTVAEAEAAAGDIAAAAQHAHTLRRLSAAHLVNYLSRMTAPEQLRFFRQWDDPGLHASLRLGLPHASLAPACAEWLLNGQAKIAEVLYEVNRHERGGPDYQKLSRSVQRQAYLLYGGGGDGAATQQALLEAELTQRDLAAKRAARPPSRWYALTELCKALAPDEVYFDIFSLRADARSPRAYYAWVVAASEPVRVVRLGEAARIERRVQDLQELMERFVADDGDYYNLGPAEAEKRLRQDCLAPLAKVILEPLLQAANGKKRWTITPDGPLWNVPWAALPLPDRGQYAVEELVIRYAISGRDLLRTPVRDLQPGAPLIVASPKFDQAPTPAGWRRRTPPDLFARLAHLPKSRQEAQRVFAALEKSFHARPPLLDEHATKESLMGMTRAPRILHLATHGFYALPTQLRVEDPLLRCGVVFAGLYYVPDGQAVKTEALPGLLTGAEVLALNLQGTELVVLSACQSGTGVTSYGQSPADLRQAFHLAGAQGVVSTLWSVDDRSTRDLMGAFMESYASGMGRDKAAALAAAQREMIGKLRKSVDRHSHPFFWAAFTLSGS